MEMNTSCANSQRGFIQSRIFLLVIEDDEQDSPARIAGKKRINLSLAEGEQ